MAGAPADDRATARLSVGDMRAAIQEIVRTEDGYAVGHDHYRTSAERARNALLGRGDRDYVAGAGDPGDGEGAIAYIDRLLDRTQVAAWTPALQGAKINLLAGAQSLTDAMNEAQMEDYQTDLTRALADISLALGRPTDTGVLGGIQGALATTTLGIPSGSHVVSACARPASSPAYGVVSGRLAFVTVSQHDAAASFPTDISIARIRASGDHLVLYTGAADAAAKLCHRETAGRRVDMVAVRRAAPYRRTRTQSLADAAAAAPSYTQTQAQAGAAVYAQACVSCHGANLQGVAAPAVAGTGFLTTVNKNGWTFSDLRTLVVQQMPLNSPGSLTPKQYADVLAFLLASNCYAPGNASFPAAESPTLAAKIAPPSGGTTPADAKLGTCTVATAAH